MEYSNRKMRNIVIFGLVILSIMTVLLMKFMRMNPPVKITTQSSSLNEAFIENRLNTYVHVTSVLADTGKEEILMGYIAPLSKKNIPKNLIRLLSPPNRLNIYVVTPIGTKTISPDQSLTECDIGEVKYSQGWEKLATFDITKPIYSFYIGDIDTKLSGVSYSDQAAGPAVYNNGIPFIEIFNMTNRTLQLNENIEIPPMGSRIYRGREHFGVPFGTILHDMENIFPDYEVIYPVSHIIYKGAVTELATDVPTYTFNVTDPLRSGLAADFGAKDKTTFDSGYEFGETRQYSNQKKYADKYR
jgi:hypothetical protein